MPFMDFDLIWKKDDQGGIIFLGSSRHTDSKSYQLMWNIGSILFWES